MSKQAFKIISISALFLIIVSTTFLNAQEIDSFISEEVPTSIYEVVEFKAGDTIVLYYNDRYQLVKPACASIYRKVKFDPNTASFRGEFTDFYMDSAKAVTGAYENSVKNGLFTIYYSNGQIESSGHYKNDMKEGRWDYYYPDGKMHQIIEFHKNRPNIIDFWDEDGKHLVTQGEGEWFGYESPERFVKIYGPVSGGKQHGKWRRALSKDKTVVNIEKYSYGELIRGRSRSVLGYDDTYADTSFCPIEFTPEFTNADNFQLNRCYPSVNNNWRYAEYPGGENWFYNELIEKIDLNYIGFLNNGTVHIQMKINKEGEMTDFKAISNLGIENEVIDALKSMKKWSPTMLNGEPRTQVKQVIFDID